MEDNKALDYIKKVLKNMPADWLNLTTHRLDIYEENLAKTQFLDKLEDLFNVNNSDTSVLNGLPTAYDYIRLGHPLSCVLEWTVAKLNNLAPDNVISFSSKTTPILAILRKNLLDNKKTQIVYSGDLPDCFDAEILRSVYAYNFELNSIDNIEAVPAFEGSTIFISRQEDFSKVNPPSNVDFYVGMHAPFGSIVLVNGESNEKYISEIQHVRRRETVAMTPANCYTVLKSLTENTPLIAEESKLNKNKSLVLDSINKITGTTTEALVASSGLSIQYAIMMGLVHDALENHKGKDIKFIVPPNCYGGTNDQARRVAACIDNVEIVDLLVDGENNMVQSIDTVLTEIAKENAVPYIIAEIPTNPRVEVPNLQDLKAVLTKERKTVTGEIAVDPVFLLDQTFCPNVHFLGEGEILSEVRAISFTSGSKFPSGGLCTAGYCVGNNRSEALMEKVKLHLDLCDNEATALQYEILAKQLPSMNQRIKDAYKNTREFVNFIHEVLPDAKINFVSEDLAEQSFTPSVFSLDLPTKGNTEE
ncbi:MAG TPA: hypothetical protein VKX30_05115, partial [Flavobacteriaceae bacterium]|nr:hypothetical protein [Flavobacteriaceae bacterium]